MNCRTRNVLCCAAILAAVSLSTITHAQTAPLAKTQVADRIRKVEDGVDQFEQVPREPRRGRAESSQLRTDQRRDNPPPAFKFWEHPNSGKPSSGEPGKANQGRPRKRDGRSESCHEPPPAQV